MRVIVKRFAKKSAFLLGECEGGGTKRKMYASRSGGVAAHTHFHTLFLHIVSKTANQQVKKGGTKVDASDYSRFSVPVGITVKF